MISEASEQKSSSRAIKPTAPSPHTLKAAAAQGFRVSNAGAVLRYVRTQTDRNNPQSRAGTTARIKSPLLQPTAAFKTTGQTANWCGARALPDSISRWSSLPKSSYAWMPYGLLFADVPSWLDERSSSSSSFSLGWHGSNVWRFTTNFQTNPML